MLAACGPPAPSREQTDGGRIGASAQDSVAREEWFEFRVVAFMVHLTVWMLSNGSRSRAGYDFVHAALAALATSGCMRKVMASRFQALMAKIA